MAIPSNNVSLDAFSEQAIENIQNSVFGDLSIVEDEQETDTDEPEDAPDTDEPEGGAEGTDDKDKGADGGEEEPEDDKDKDKASEEEAIDYASLSEPLGDLLPEGFEVKSKEDFTKALTDFSAQYREEIEANEALVGLFEKHGEFGALARELNNNPEASFHQILFKVVGDEKGQIIPDKNEDPEAYADYVLAKKEREKEAEAAKKQQEQNVEASKKAVDKFREQNDFAEQDVNNIMKKAHEMIQNISKGKVTEEFLDIMAKGMNYEKAVDEASKEAETRGRNTAATKHRRQKKGDGLPKLSGKGGSSTKSKQAGKKGGGLAAAALQRAIDPTAW